MARGYARAVRCTSTTNVNKSNDKEFGEELDELGVKERVGGLRLDEGPRRLAVVSPVALCLRWHSPARHWEDALLVRGGHVLVRGGRLGVAKGHNGRGLLFCRPQMQAHNNA